MGDLPATKTRCDGSGVSILLSEGMIISIKRSNLIKCLNRFEKNTDEEIHNQTSRKDNTASQSGNCSVPK